MIIKKDPQASLMFGRKKKNTDQKPRSASSRPSRTVFSYYQNRVIPNDESVESQRAREQKQERKASRLPTLIALIVIVGCVGYILSVDRNPKIIVVNEQDQATSSLLRPTQTYQSAAQKILKDSPLNYSKLTMSTAGVAKALQAQFPEITEATVSLPLINRRPVMYLQITSPVFLLNKGNDIYALDEQGRVIMKGDATLPASGLPHIVDQTSQEANISKPYLPVSQIKFLQQVQAQLEAKGIHDASFMLPALANEVYVKLKDKPYYVKLTFSSDARQQIGSFLAVKQKLEADKITPAEYIDARVEDRAYYK